MKKLISLLLILLLVLSLFGCGKAASVTVTCRDENGAAVVGVKVQLCTASSCLMAETDADGKAVFDTEPAEYEIHVYKVPEGFAKPEQDVVNTTAQDSEIQFTIPAAN